jgi:hypothetical protein
VTSISSGIATTRRAFWTVNEEVPMSTRSLRARIIARRNYRAFERALERARRYGGAGDLQAQYRRL